jgi:hypothetical protein
MKTYLLGLLTLAFAFAGVAGRAAAQTDYLIGPQDVLTITVFGEADLSGKYTVEQDGTFTFPQLGRIKAGGMTLRALEQELKKQLAPVMWCGQFSSREVPAADKLQKRSGLFIGDLDGHVYCLSLDDGSTLWMSENRGGTCASLVVAGDVVNRHQPVIGTLRKSQHRQCPFGSLGLSALAPLPLYPTLSIADCFSRILTPPIPGVNRKCLWLPRHPMLGQMVSRTGPEVLVTRQ